MYLNLTSSSPAQIFNIKLQLNNVCSLCVPTYSYGYFKK